MKRADREQSVSIGGSAIRMRRTTGGVAELWAEDDLALLRGLGFVHARDRLVQMVLLRLTGEGRLSECLRADDETLAIDVFMRQRGFARTAQEEAAEVPEEGRRFAEAYCAGVNAYLRRHRRPLELLLVGHRPAPWTVADVLLTIKLISYVGLAQLQEDLEKLLIQAVQDGVAIGRLQRLFAPHLDGLTEDLVELIREVTFVRPAVPRLPAAVPVFSASNNWAVSGARSASGFPLQCNDPHMDCRLPPVWYEILGHVPDDYRLGVTVPGVPGLIMGRTKEISYGVTYGMMDMIDFFIEDCRGGHYRRGDEDIPLSMRKEIIRRRGDEPLEVTVFETDQGVLETAPFESRLEDGFYLCRAYSAHRTGAARSLQALAALPAPRTVPEFQRVVREVSLSGNWVIADCAGNIGYQQSGRLPVRSHSGLFPVPAWDDRRRWRETVSAENLSTLLNPESGIIATANDDWNQPGKPQSITAPSGLYRARRLRNLLDGRTGCTLDDMERIQTDVASQQADRFMALVRPLIPDTPAGRILAEWDLRYDSASRGATLFEILYHRLLREVFGEGMFGDRTWGEVVTRTAVVCVYHQHFDEILLNGDESWFGGEGREALFRRIVSEVAAEPVDSVRSWGEAHRVTLRNLFFEENLPPFLSRALGITLGPWPLNGSWATIAQGSIFRLHGRTATAMPVYRFLTDLGENGARTALAGGPSGRIWSGLYAADLDRRWADEYKRLDGAGS